MPLGGFQRDEAQGLACRRGLLVAGKGLQGHGSVAKGARPRFFALPEVILVLYFLQALLLAAACRPRSVGFI